jgi:zinc-ribbon family
MPIIIFGMRRRAKQHGGCVAASCPRCHNEVVLVYLVVTRYFSLFFIPVIPISKKRMLMCPICSWQREIPKSSEHLALEMIGITQQWQGKQLADAEYGRRVDAFWSFLTNEAPAANPSDAGGPPPTSGSHEQTPPPPPAPPSA